MSDSMFQTDGKEIYQKQRDQIAARTSRMFAWLLVAEWIGAVVVALVLSPRTWEGASSYVHPHVWAALLLGFALAAIPCVFIVQAPTVAFTRHLIAVSQMLMSGLLIDVTGGRIETHFLIFGSLAFLAFFQDWRVLVTATAVTAADHIVVGVWWPASIYGLTTVSPWRWVEHAWWVIFEDFFLMISMGRSLAHLRTLAQREAWLSHGAHHDVLTGLANRRALDTYFTQLLTAPENSGIAAVPSQDALLFIDLDRFKQLNDTLGHRAGDEFLAETATRISAAVRTGDLVARIGGDEFVVIARSISNREEAAVLAGRILDHIGRPTQFTGSEVLISGSIGISLCPEHGVELLSLQEAADKAMYQAKALGRNQFCFYSPDLNEASKQDLKQDLYQAIGTPQMEAHFQPQVDSEGRITGLEALSRWTHPVQGKVPPCEFIPLAESCGLIVPLGEWVLRAAVRECRAWNAARDSNIRVAVNVSALQLQTADFSSVVESILEFEDLAPSLLELEVTESVLIADPKTAYGHLSRLRQIGVTVAIDDFGTGYSSLGALQNLPVDRLKLDRCFMLRTSPEQTVVLRSIMKLAHTLGLSVVAEGVETIAQLEMLRSMNCDGIQGYLVSPPVPVEELSGVFEIQRENRIA